LPIPGESFTRS